MCGHLASPVLLLQNNQMFRQTQGGVQAPAFTDLSVIKKGDKKKTPDNEVPEDLVENKGEEPGFRKMKQKLINKRKLHAMRLKKDAMRALRKRRLWKPNLDRINP